MSDEGAWAHTMAEATKGAGFAPGPPGGAGAAPFDPDVEWGDPDPVDQGLEAPAPFPAGVLPPTMAAMVDAVAEHKQVPEDLPALIGFACLATLAAPRFVVERDTGWVEPLNGYYVVAMPPGTRKSPVVADMDRPIWELEREQRRVWKRAQDAKKQAIAGKSGGGTDGGASDFDAGSSGDGGAKERPPALLVGDATPEALEVEMAANHGALASIDSEGGTFAHLSGRYSGGNPNLELALKAYDAGWYRSARITREASEMERAVLTLGLAVQPDVLSQVLTPGKDGRQSVMRERGLLGRFWYAWPENFVGRRRAETEPVPATVRAAWRETLRRIAAMPIPSQALDRPLPALRLSKEARKLHVEFQEWIETRMDHDTGELSFMVDWASKHTGRILRMAGLMHLALLPAKNPEKWVATPISEETMRAAITLGHWGIPHAAKVYGGQAAARQGTDRLLAVLAWVRRKAAKADFESFTLRDALRELKTQAWVVDEGAAAVESAVARLVAAGWLRIAGKNRKSNSLYGFHPSLRDPVSRPGRALGPGRPTQPPLFDRPRHEVTESGG